MSYWEDMSYDTYDWGDSEFFSDQYGGHRSRRRRSSFVPYPSLNLREIDLGHLIFYIEYMENNHPEYKDRITEAKNVLGDRLGEAEFGFTERK